MPHLLTTALPTERRNDALAIARAGVAAADAARLTERALADAGAAGSRGWPKLDHVLLLAAGKAARAMAEAAVQLLGRRIRSGLIVGPDAHSPGRGRLPRPEEGREQEAPLEFETIIGGHPLPTDDSERAGRRALALAESLSPGETLLVLLSGGGSALLAVPADGLTLDDKRQTTRQLLLAGADIHALNTVRKHLSAIKGGWLAARASGPSLTLAISDVVGDDPGVIASGPTVADATTFDDALAVLQEYAGLDAYPQAVVARLHSGARGEWPDTPKPGDPRLSRAVARVIGSRADAMDGAVREASLRGYHVIRLDTPVVGEARDAAIAHLRDVLAREDVRQLMAQRQQLCVVSSGETTVHVTGNGKGGRNQEFALAAASALPGRAVLVSLGTDGIDGPTDAAGAIVDSTTLDRARAAGLDPSAALMTNDAYSIFDRLGDLIRIGPTGTNVGDLQVLLL